MLLENFNDKACYPVPTAVVYTHTFIVTGTTWTFVYKEEVICICAAAKQTEILLESYCFLPSFDIFFGIWCEFDGVCLLLEGLACLLDTALL